MQEFFRVGLAAAEPFVDDVIRPLTDQKDAVIRGFDDHRHPLSQRRERDDIKHSVLDGVAVYGQDGAVAAPLSEDDAHVAGGRHQRRFVGRLSLIVQKAVLVAGGNNGVAQRQRKHKVLVVRALRPLGKHVVDVLQRHERGGGLVVLRVGAQILEPLFHHFLILSNETAPAVGFGDNVDAGAPVHPLLGLGVC